MPLTRPRRGNYRAFKMRRPSRARVVARWAFAALGAAIACSVLTAPALAGAGSGDAKIFGPNPVLAGHPDEWTIRYHATEDFAASGGVLEVEIPPGWTPPQNVNSIAPCIFWTPLTQPILSDEKMYKLFMARIPWGRAAEPEDFVGATVFLASNASEFVTGHVLYVDGGSVAG